MTDETLHNGRVPVPYYVTFNSDTVWAERYVTVQAVTYLDVWDRCEKVFARTTTIYAAAGWTNYQGLTVAQRRNLTEVSWEEAVRGWVHPSKRKSPYEGGDKK